jgi:hypothetical protein
VLHAAEVFSLAGFKVRIVSIKLLRLRLCGVSPKFIRLELLLVVITCGRAVASTDWDLEPLPKIVGPLSSH